MSVLMMDIIVSKYISWKNDQEDLVMYDKTT